MTKKSQKPPFEYFQWKHDLIAELRAGSQMAPIDNGPIEYAIQGRNQPVVVGCHGGPGGYDQAFPLWSDIASNGFTLLSWSRPGYLRTPLSVGYSFKAQADALAALLDYLDIKQAAVLGFSASGPCAMFFAAYYPERVWALVLESAVTQAYRFIARDHLAEQFFARILFNDPAMWLYNQLAAYFPRYALKSLMMKESSLDNESVEAKLNHILQDSGKVSHLMELIKSMSPFSLRQEGLENDLSQLAVIDELPMEKIQAPTLVIHGTEDGDVPFCHAEFAASRIPLAELFPVPGGFHLLTLTDKAEEITARRLRMLLQHVPGGVA